MTRVIIKDEKETKEVKRLRKTWTGPGKKVEKLRKNQTDEMG